MDANATETRPPRAIASVTSTRTSRQHANFEAARDLAMRRYDALVALQREHDELADERDEWRERAQAAERRLRDIEGIAEGHVGEIAAGQLPPPLFD